MNIFVTVYVAVFIISACLWYYCKDHATLMAIFPILFFISLVTLSFLYLIFRPNIRYVDIFFISILSLIVFLNINHIFFNIKILHGFRDFVIQMFKNDLKPKWFRDAKNVIKNNKYFTSERPLRKKHDRPCIYVANHFPRNMFVVPYLISLPEDNEKILASNNYPSELEDNIGWLTIGRNNFQSNKNNKYELTKNLIKNELAKGVSVITFPEDLSKSGKGIYNLRGKCRTGIFRISQELNIPVVPMIIDWKNHGYIYPGKVSKHINVYILDKLEDKTPEEMAVDTVNIFETFLKDL